MSLEIKGKLFEVSNEEHITDTFKKREFILHDDSNPTYPEFIKFELMQDKCSIIDSFKVGDEINVFFNLKGRKYVYEDTQKVVYFGNNGAWKIEAVAPLMGDVNVTQPGPSKDGDLPF